MTIMIAILVLDAASYGILLAFGIFQDYYQTKFADHEYASWIAVLSEGIPFLGAPAITWCCQKYSLPRKTYIWIGFSLCVIGLVSSAFIDSLPGLIMMQGIVYGFGVLLVSIPELIILNTWFDKRRGLAYGIVYAGADLFGVAYTFIATQLLHHYTFRTTMLVFAAMTLVLMGLPILFIHERIELRPPTAPSIKSTTPLTSPTLRRSSTISSVFIDQGTQKITPNDLPFSPSLNHAPSWPAEPPAKRYYQRSIFYIFTLINLLQALAWYLPFIYLPSFLTAQGHSAHSGATALAIGNLAMIVGDLVFGKLSDKVHVNTLLIASTAVSALATFFLWGMGGSVKNSLPATTAFIFLYGCFGGGFLALWARMGTVFGEKDAQMVYSTLCFGRGIGGILSGPVSQVLLAKGTPYALRALSSGTYGGVIMFVGMCTAGAALMGGCGILALWWKKGKESEVESRSGSRSEVEVITVNEK